MKLFALVVAALALAAGFAGGLRAYSVAAPASAAPVQVSAPHYPKAMPVKPGATFRWAPCQKPAVRHGRACVTTVTRTVTLPPPAAAPTSAAPVQVAVPAHAAPTRHPQATQPTSQPTYHDDGGDGGEHHDGGGGGDD